MHYLVIAAAQHAHKGAGKGLAIGAALILAVAVRIGTIIYNRRNRRK